MLFKMFINIYIYNEIIVKFYVIKWEQHKKKNGFKITKITLKKCKYCQI